MVQQVSFYILKHSVIYGWHAAKASWVPYFSSGLACACCVQTDTRGFRTFTWPGFVAPNCFIRPREAHVRICLQVEVLVPLILMEDQLNYKARQVQADKSRPL